MISQADAERAKTQVRNILDRLFGPNLEGIVSFGVRFDIKTRDLFIGINVDPGVPSIKTARIPNNMLDVPVRVSWEEPAELETMEI